MKSALFFLLLLFATAFYAQAQSTQNTPAKSETDQTTKTDDDDYVRPDSKKRQKRYVKSIVGPMALAKTTVSAGFSTWRNSPPEWGTKWEGFGRRFASGMGKSFIKSTTQFGLDEAFKLDSAFYRSKKKSWSGRFGDAIVSPFVARDKNGKKVFGFPRVFGTYASNVIAAETWYPSRYTYKDGLKSGTISLGFTAAFNVIKEFVLKK